ncbi:sporulation protein YlmC with PRC-barrel domain [Marmoricola sp. OAE513]|uniref:hypothetical protein n=1 Tax=Marmoricola sp. OAE513 TaxID=2817894 RepID=UPI001AE6F3CF
MTNRLHGEHLDAALHLLDRQVVDVEGLAVCKVDDLEITLYADGGAPAVTRILVGPAALVPRLSSRSGHWLRARWVSLGIQYADRDVPLSLPLTVVRHLGSAVELSVGRAGLLDRQPRGKGGDELRRMGELVGMQVASDAVGGKVLDVRLSPDGDRFVVDQLVVGPGRPGSLLGYDRGDFNGPWLVARAVAWLHRHIRLVDWSAVQCVDWDSGVVVLAAGGDQVHELGRRGN